MKKIIALGFAVLLSACSSEHKSVPHPEDGQLPPLNFNVAAIDFVAGTPKFEDQFRKGKYFPKFAAALQQWAQRAFVSSGQRGTLIVSIEQAKIEEAAVPREAKLLTYVESEKYDGKLAVRLELRDENGAVRESNVTAVEHTISVLENISPEQRDREIEELVNSLVNELDHHMRKNVKKHLSGYMSYAPPLLTTDAGNMSVTPASE